MPITTDVEVMLGRDLTDLEIDRIDRLIALAIAAVEAAIPGFAITEGSHTVDVYPSDPSSLWTPRYPIAAVDTLAANGNNLDPTTYRWDELGRVTLGSWTEAAEFSLVLVSSAKVTITYDYGFATIPDDVALVVAAMVAATLRQQRANPDGSQSIGVDGYNEAFGESSAVNARRGMVFPDGELRRWRRNRVVSVPLVGRAG